MVYFKVWYYSGIYSGKLKNRQDSLLAVPTENLSNTKFYDETFVFASADPYLCTLVWCSVCVCLTMYTPTSLYSFLLRILVAHNGKIWCTCSLVICAVSVIFL
jgi:hypothetical protein